jgi:Type II secretion system (T2SS), protein E, N-terminal domain
MLSRGYIDEQQLQKVLVAQREAGSGRMGSWALKLQFVTERQLLNILSLQWSCPVLALQTPPGFACVELMPWNLLCSLRMMPVRFVRSTRLLYVAVCEGTEHSSLAAIEQIPHCRVVPCLVTDGEMDRWLESETRTRAPRVLVFEKTSGAAEMARSPPTMPFGWGPTRCRSSVAGPMAGCG